MTKSCDRYRLVSIESWGLGLDSITASIFLCLGWVWVRVFVIETMTARLAGDTT